MHKHKCKFCGFVWGHADASDVSHNAVPGSHECPGCHRCNWGLGIYDGPEEPRVTNGLPAEVECEPVVTHSDQKYRSP